MQEPVSPALTVWRVKEAGYGSSYLTKLLRASWEPFGISPMSGNKQPGGWLLALMLRKFMDADEAKAFDDAGDEYMAS